jgi:hypothetical protein
MAQSTFSPTSNPVGKIDMPRRDSKTSTGKGFSHRVPPSLPRSQTRIQTSRGHRREAFLHGYAPGPRCDFDPTRAPDAPDPKNAPAPRHGRGHEPVTTTCDLLPLIDPSPTTATLLALELSLHLPLELVGIHLEQPTTLDSSAIRGSAEDPYSTEACRL